MVTYENYINVLIHTPTISIPWLHPPTIINYLYNIFAAIYYCFDLKIKIFRSNMDSFLHIYYFKNIYIVEEI